MKIKKRFIQKVISVFAAVLLLVNSFSPFLLIVPAFSQVKAQTETVTPIPTVEPTVVPTETVTPTPTVIPEPIPPQAPSQWTFEKVEPNKEYIAPQNSEVKLTFTKLPDPSGNIKIEEIILTEDQIKQTGSLSNKAYDITSDMKDGDFSYNLSLPIPESSKGEAVEVKFAEEVSKINSAEKVDNTLTKTDSSVLVKSLDHFTIFIISGTITNPGPDTYVGEPFPETSSSVIINEFLFDPSTGNEWIELFNKTNGDINLANWQLINGNGDADDLILTGTLPANGILVFEKLGGDGWLNNADSESITLKDSNTETQDIVSYKDSSFVNAQEIGDVIEDQSVCRTSDGGDIWQACTSSSKGWFNDAETFDCVTPPSGAPTLTSIAECLGNDQGISTNIGTIDNPSATPDTEAGDALYFGNSEGKIVFEKTLNLSDQNTVSVLQSLGMAMEMTANHIKFNSETAAAMAATGAKIYMYEIFGYDSAPDIFIKNDAGETLGTNDPEAIDLNSIVYDPDNGELSFTALHFTQFDLPSAPSTPVLHEVSSPTNDTTPTLSWDDVSATPEVTSYDIDLYDSDGNNLYDSYITSNSSSFTFEDADSLGEGDYFWYVRTNNAIGSSDWSNEGSFTIDTVAPDVSKLGDGSTDVTLEAGDNYLTFSEILSDSSKTAVQNALTAGANKGLTYIWSDNTLVITASETTTFANDVVVNVFDLAGNVANSLLLVDSSLTATQSSPDGSGNVTADSDSPEVVVTDPDDEVTVTVDGETEATIDVGSFITDGTGTIPKITINSGSAEVAIPATVVTGPADWDGVITAPTITTIDLPVVSGETSSLGTAIEIGFATDKLSFADAVRILLPGQAGKRAGYSRPETAFMEITSICSSDSQAAGDSLEVDGECKIDAGLDLVIWTKHFTKFAAYTQTTNSTSTSSSTSSSSGSTTKGSAAPACSDQKPGSAPVLLSAVAGLNSVTLNWTKASDPVSYYLVTFGTKPGEQLYGNPNVGGSNTTSYTIGNLSGGKTYYFKVRAGNGCMPGDYSNEVTGSPSGGFVGGIPEGFAAGVLGAQDQITPTGVPVGKVAPSLVPNSAGTSPRLGFFQRVWNFILGLFKR